MVVTTRVSRGAPPSGLTCFCAAMRFWSLFLQAGSWRCWKVSYPVVIPVGRRTWEQSKASVKPLQACPCLLPRQGTWKGPAPVPASTAAAEVRWGDEEKNSN